VISIDRSDATVLRSGFWRRLEAFDSNAEAEIGEARARRVGAREEAL